MDVIPANSTIPLFSDLLLPLTLMRSKHEKQLHSYLNYNKEIKAKYMSFTKTERAFMEYEIFYKSMTFLHWERVVPPPVANS